MNCAHAAMTLPANIASPQVQTLFERERQPAYFVTNRTVAKRLSNVVYLGEYDERVILQASAGQGQAGVFWDSPAPPICAGRESDGRAFGFDAIPLPSR